MNRHSLLLALTLTCAAGTRMLANDIQVSNAVLSGNNTTTNTCFVQFDLAWQNSWREGGVANWDAAWVFVKFRTISGVWQHARLSATGHLGTTGLELVTGLKFSSVAFNAVTNPVIGMMVQRNAPGTGAINAAGMQLKWNYGGQGLAFNDIVEVRVYGVEMVYVNGGMFAAGSGGTETNAFTLTTITRTPNSIAATLTPPGPLGGFNGGYPTNAPQAVNPFYPNGFLAFYCMKYEISQQQYVDFLNTLTRVQQDARTGTNLAAAVTSVTNRFVMSNTSTLLNRNGIACSSSILANDPIDFFCDANGNAIGNEADDGLWRACNFLSTADHSAYMDWSGLRPMSEMEFEKACRGPMLPLANEFAWGTTAVTGLQYGLTLNGKVGESISSFYALIAGNAAHSGTAGTLGGPLRVGIFAGNVNNDGRVSSGASYYGIMELGGNISEITVENSNGDNFDFDEHGDGGLPANGIADVSGWPGLFGAILRGGSFLNPSSTLRVSDRSNLGVNGLLVRQANVGGRGVRAAP